MHVKGGFGLLSAGIVALAHVAPSTHAAESMDRLETIPAFARQYGVSCSLCHQPAPRLTDFGEQFAANGFRLALDEEPVDTLDTGDDQLQLMADIPLAIRLDAYLAGTTRDESPSVDLQTPWTIKLLSGGRVSEKVSYYLYFFMSERGEVAGLEDAIVQFSDLGGSGVDVVVGQFQVSDPLFKRELRLQYEDYQPYRVRVGDASADLTYDRGIMAGFSPWSEADLSLQVVNGQGLRESGPGRSYDTDDGKAAALRFSQSFGAVRLGAFGYYGVETAQGIDNEIRMFGPDVSVFLGPTLEFNGQYLRRLDDQPFFEPFGLTDTDVDMGFAELVWSPRGAFGQWFFTALYNHIEADAPIFTIRQGEAGLLDSYRSAALGGNYMMARNLRLTTEVQYDLDREDARFIIGFMSAF
ncbi:MAG TPA: hypothetical protein VK966_05600 [Longimicrobiales bacterium]|nr:hypothetical protein [Longimicrobiales bacterium]